MSKLAKFEPKPKKLTNTKPPRDLNPDAKKAWRMMAPRLEALGLFTELDVNTFRRYCEMLARWLHCSAKLNSNNWQTHIPIFHEQTPQEIEARIKPRLKYLQELPESVEYRQLPRELLRLEQQFGMTPAARAAINVLAPGGGAKRKSEVKDFLYGTSGEA